MDYIVTERIMKDALDKKVQILFIRNMSHWEEGILKEAGQEDYYYLENDEPIHLFRRFDVLDMYLIEDDKAPIPLVLF